MSVNTSCLIVHSLKINLRKCLYCVTLCSYHLAFKNTWNNSMTPAVLTVFLCMSYECLFGFSHLGKPWIAWRRNRPFQRKASCLDPAISVCPHESGGKVTGTVRCTFSWTHHWLWRTLSRKFVNKFSHCVVRMHPHTVLSPPSAWDEGTSACISKLVVHLLFRLFMKPWSGR